MSPESGGSHDHPAGRKWISSACPLAPCTSTRLSAGLERIPINLHRIPAASIMARTEPRLWMEGLSMIAVSPG